MKKMMNPPINDLKTIYIRAKIDGKWQAVSIFDAPIDQVQVWFTKKMVALTELPELPQKVAMVRAVETSDTKLVRFKNGRD